MEITKTAYKIGEVVFLITDPEQHERIVTGFNIRPGRILYELSFCTEITSHYEFEIATTKKVF